MVSIGCRYLTLKNNLGVARRFSPHTRGLSTRAREIANDGPAQLISRDTIQKAFKLNCLLFDLITAETFILSTISPSTFALDQKVKVTMNVKRNKEC